MLYSILLTIGFNKKLHHIDQLKSRPLRFQVDVYSERFSLHVINMVLAQCLTCDENLSE
jgi:hypothetical protein